MIHVGKNLVPRVCTSSMARFVCRYAVSRFQEAGCCSSWHSTVIRSGNSSLSADSLSRQCSGLQFKSSMYGVPSRIQYPRPTASKSRSNRQYVQIVNAFKSSAHASSSRVNMSCHQQYDGSMADAQRSVFGHPLHQAQERAPSTLEKRSTTHTFHGFTPISPCSLPSRHCPGS